MIKVLYRLWKAVSDHTHCYSDKKYDATLNNGDRVIVMRCCQCWKEQTKIIKYKNGDEENGSKT